MNLPELARILAFVDQRMGALLERPDGWGSPESVELQLLLLIEMRHTTLGRPESDVDKVNDRYQDFIDRQRPGPPTSLAARLGLSRRATPEFIALLRQFLAEERGLLAAASPRLPLLDAQGPNHYGDA